ncbi:hypothetical protein [Parasitella parasitica]|uniref:Reverse transcriptase domain-containing protein n=1 Tax=Parasitella parasitica TaxID=35722 RepID=A0A0B7N9I8_9FUNG|nr:hypothetical protein [Parasitella parasitica]
MQDAAKSFYILLYSPNPVDQNCIQELCSIIPPQARMADTDHVFLEQPFTILELLQGTECTSLSSSPRIHVNINGHISDFVPQHRGIRQDDPTSPLLFNIAFDPFLRSVQQNSAFNGFNLPHEAPSHGELDGLSDAFNNLYLQPTATNYTMSTIANSLLTLTLEPPSLSGANQLKILAYVDDTLVYLWDAEDLPFYNRSLLNLFQSQAGLSYNGIRSLLHIILLIGMTAPHPHHSLILDILLAPALPNEMLPSNNYMIQFAMPTHNEMSLCVAGLLLTPLPYVVIVEACFDACATNSYYHSSVDAVTCLSLPLYETFLPSLPTNYPSNIYPNFRPPHQLFINQSVVEKLLIRNVFLFDTKSQALRLRQSSAQFVCHRTVCSRTGNLISSFFRRCCDSNHHFYHDPTFGPFCFSLLVPSTPASL